MSVLRVVVAWSPGPREVVERVVELAPGSTLRAAVAASGWGGVCAPASEPRSLAVSIWGRRCGWDQPLRDGDRVEILRELTVDPKVARRERFRAQGARATGLFAARRPGAKPGY